MLQRFPYHAAGDSNLYSMITNPLKNNFKKNFAPVVTKLHPDVPTYENRKPTKNQKQNQLLKFNKNQKTKQTP
jgi:hypothetical protein